MESYEEILERMERTYREESGHCAGDVTDTGLRLKVLAGELYRLRAEIAWLRRQAFPDTAEGQWLDRHGNQRGVPRQEGTHAVGSIVFSRYLPLSFDVVIPKGTVCASSGELPVEYETTEEAVLAAGSLTVSAAARAAAAGPGGNLAAGRINTLVTPATGVNYVTNTVPFTGGRDREEDEAYRLRVLAAYREGSSGTNAAAYRDVALAYPGITSAAVKPRVNGAGTVGVYVWGQGSAPSAAVIQGLSAEFENRRELGVAVSVQAATAVSVAVTLRLRVAAGADSEKALADAEAAIRRHFAGLGVGSPVYKLDLERAVLAAAPVTGLEWGLNVHDVAGDPAKIPVPGTVSVEELT